MRTRTRIRRHRSRPPGEGGMGKPWAARRPGRRSDSEFARSILIAVPEAVIVLDGLGRVLELNPAAERLLGTRREDAVASGLPPSITGAGDENPGGRFAVRAARDDGTT